MFTQFTCFIYCDILFVHVIDIVILLIIFLNIKILFSAFIVYFKAHLYTIEFVIQYLIVILVYTIKCTRHCKRCLHFQHSPSNHKQQLCPTQRITYIRMKIRQDKLYHIDRPLVLQYCKYEVFSPVYLHVQCTV